MPSAVGIQDALLKAQHCGSIHTSAKCVLLALGSARTAYLPGGGDKQSQRLGSFRQGQWYGLKAGYPTGSPALWVYRVPHWRPSVAGLIGYLIGGPALQTHNRVPHWRLSVTGLSGRSVLDLFAKASGTGLRQDAQLEPGGVGL